MFIEIPRYTEEERASRTSRTIVMRLELDESGFIPKITFLKTLSNGLSRQAVFAALRIKFLPAEKDGQPVSSTRSLEHTFSIY